MTWTQRALLLIARTVLRCERHIIRLDADGRLGVKTGKAVALVADEEVRLRGLAEET